jgi:hypothetical protein
MVPSISESRCSEKGDSIIDSGLEMDCIVTSSVIGGLE